MMACEEENIWSLDFGEHDFCEGVARYRCRWPHVIISILEGQKMDATAQEG